MMKERPIIFSTEMVKAILEGRKTQTRRVIKPQPSTDYYGHQWMFYNNPSKRLQINDYTIPVLCPYGQVGDRLWVKETLYRNPYFDEAGYIADNSPVMVNQTIGDTLKWRWKRDILPAIFMPREASRITLEITEVRAERLQDIDNHDSWQELGMSSYFEWPEKYWKGFELGQHECREVFAELWDSLNPKHPWESNPWVWVISFRRI